MLQTAAFWASTRVVKRKLCSVFILFVWWVHRKTLKSVTRELPRELCTQRSSVKVSRNENKTKSCSRDRKVQVDVKYERSWRDVGVSLQIHNLSMMWNECLNERSAKIRWQQVALMPEPSADMSDLKDRWRRAPGHKGGVSLARQDAREEEINEREKEEAQRRREGDSLMTRGRLHLNITPPPTRWLYWLQFPCCQNWLLNCIYCNHYLYQNHHCYRANAIVSTANQYYSFYYYYYRILNAPTVQQFTKIGS